MSDRVVPSRRADPGVTARLVRISRQQPVPADAEVAVEELVEAARFHRIAPLVHVAHRDSAPEVAALFQADRLAAIAGHLAACGALQQLASALGDIEWVTFKGPVFSENAHPVRGLRSYNDVDVLVHPLKLREVSGLLSAAGWQVADYEDMLHNRAVPGEMHWVSPGGVFIDLHWSMINMAARRRLFQISTAELLARRVRTSVGSHEVWTLHPTDALVHACLHAALSGAHKLLYLIDVHHLSREISDWDEVAQRARQWRAQAQVALVLGRAQRVLDTPVPADLATRLEASRGLRALMAATDRVAPTPAVRRNQGLAKFVSRAVRPTGPATAAVLSRHGVQWVGDRLRRRTPPPAQRHRADAAALEVYLGAVERAAALS